VESIPFDNNMSRKWTVEHIEALAELCPETGEDHVKQLFQWEHDVSKGWALALLGAALAFIGSAALSFIDKDAGWWAALFLVVGGLALALVAYTLNTLSDLSDQYLDMVHRFARARNGM